MRRTGLMDRDKAKGVRAIALELGWLFGTSLASFDALDGGAAARDGGVAARWRAGDEDLPLVKRGGPAGSAPSDPTQSPPIGADSSTTW